MRVWCAIFVTLKLSTERQRKIKTFLSKSLGAAKKRLAWVPLEHHQYQVKNINADGKLFGWSWICDYTVIVQFCDSMVR